MTWNIKTGGVDRGRGDRLAAIAAVIAAERPDVLALQELRDFHRHDGRRMRAMAESVGMVAHLARSIFGQPVAVLVRPPLEIIRTATVTWRLHHAAAAVTVATGAGPLTVVSTHLNPFRAERRRREATWLAARFAASAGAAPGPNPPMSPGRPALAVLAGDLNSLDPHTDHTAEIERLPALYHRRHVDPDGTVNTRAIAALERGGLLDLFRTAGAGDGRTAPTTQGGGAEFSGMRLDYVLATAPVAARARDARVIRGGDAEFASDHYPVRVDLDL